jgi:hypothetical protein
MKRRGEALAANGQEKRGPQGGQVERAGGRPSLRSIVRRPRLLYDPRAVAERDLRIRPAFDGGREGRVGEEEAHDERHATGIGAIRTGAMALGAIGTAATGRGAIGLGATRTGATETRATGRGAI